MSEFWNHDVRESDAALKRKHARSNDLLSEKIKVGVLKVALQRTGFVICDRKPDETACDDCGKKDKQLYFGNKDYYSGDGDYFCADCVIKLFIDNEQTMAEFSR